MEEYIQISKINDYLYSPKSLYLHSVYESFSQNTYHEEPQKTGKLNHEKIDKGTYSTAKRYIQGIPVYSENYNIGGKIDIYDKKEQILIERKTKIKQIYDGHRYQLFAQMFCLEEVSYPVKELCIHSLQDNRRYFIDKPSPYDIEEFEKTLEKMRRHNASTYKNIWSDANSGISIYRHLGF